MSSRLFAIYQNNYNIVVEKVQRLLKELGNANKNKRSILNKEIELAFKEIERAIFQMEFETNSMRNPEMKERQQSEVQEYKSKIEELKKKHLEAVANPFGILISHKKVENPYKELRDDSAVEVKTDEKEVDKYAINRVGFFTFLIHKFTLIIYNTELRSKIKKHKILIILPIVIFILMFFTILYKLSTPKK